MRIKTQLLISIITFSIILVIIGSSVALTQIQINELNNQSVLTNEIQTGASDLNYISNNYFLYQDNSYITSWQTKFSTLSNEIATLNSTNLQKQALVNTVSRDMENLNSVFAGVTSFLSTAPRNVSVRVDPNFQTQWNRMAVQIQALAFDSQQLSQNIQDQTNQAIMINTTLTVALLSIFVAFFIIIYFVAYRRTSRSITKLKNGIGVIGSGNLDYTIEAGKKDEIADISKSVNQMAANLKTVTASKTDLELAQASLRESEQRWATTLASIGDAVIATDTSGKIVFVNGEAEELTGWAMSEALTKPVRTVFNIINEQTRLEVESPIDRVLREGMVVGLANHTVLIRKDGSEVPIDDSGAPIRDKEGKTTGVVLVFRDITERKKAEEATKRQADLIDLSPDAIIVMTLEGAITFWSKGAEDLYGWTTNEASGQMSQSLLKTVFPEPLNSITSQVKTSGRWSGELHHRTKDGRNIIVQSWWLAEKDEQGEVRGILESNIDISHRKQMEAKLEEYARNLEGLVEERTKKLEGASLYARRLIEASLDPLVTISAEGKVIDVNKATELATGCSRKELIGSDFSGYFTEPEKAEAGYKQVFREGFVIDYPLAIKHKSGKITDVLYNAAVYRNEAGEAQGVFAAARDITQRKSLEKQLKDSERLAAIGATAGMVGHDIRNPLQAMTGDIYLAQTDLALMPESEEKKNVLESLREIEKNIDYVNKIVADLQDFARPIAPKLEEIDLEKTVHSVLAKLNIPGNVTVKHTIRKDFPKIKLDQSYIQRILTNLSNNAIQAMPNGGKLTIAAATKNGKAIISVEDNGEGIPEAVRNKLFTPLVTTKSKGQGFGLSVVKRFTEGMGGTVSFESEVGKGTKFIIELPI